MIQGTFRKQGHTALISRKMRPLNIKLRGNVYEGSLNTIFFAELNLITSFLIYESWCKKIESSVPSDCEWRAVIKFLNAERGTGSEIHRRLSNVYVTPYSWPKT